MPPPSPRYRYHGLAGLAGLIPDDDPLPEPTPPVRCRRCDVEVDIPASVAAEFAPYCGERCLPMAPTGKLKQLPQSYMERAL